MHDGRDACAQPLWDMVKYPWGSSADTTIAVSLEAQEPMTSLADRGRIKYTSPLHLQGGMARPGRLDPVRAWHTASSPESLFQAVAIVIGSPGSWDIPGMG